MSKTSEVKVTKLCLEGTQPSIVDASQFISGTPTQQRGFAIELAESVRRCGFVKVINHGLPDELIDELFAWVSLFQLTAIFNADALSRMRNSSRLSLSRSRPLPIPLGHRHNADGAV